MPTSGDGRGGFVIVPDEELDRGAAYGLEARTHWGSTAHKEETGRPRQGVDCPSDKEEQFAEGVREILNAVVKAGGPTG